MNHSTGKTRTCTPANLDQRPDLAIVADWIKPGSKVLDLGCADGLLLQYLQTTKNVTGYGVEIDDCHIGPCLRNGINVIQGNLDQGLSEFDDNSFDYVVLSMTLQAMHNPAPLLDEMLRVGTAGIVTFPNFGHWKIRYSLGIHGILPVTPSLPHQWYNTPNIRLCTLGDFEALCRQRNIRVQQRQTMDHNHGNSTATRLFPSLFGEIALYRFVRLVA